MGDTRQYLETLLVVTAWVRGAAGILQIEATNAANTLRCIRQTPQQRIILSEVSQVPQLRATELNTVVLLSPFTTEHNLHGSPIYVSYPNMCIYNSIYLIIS